MLQFFGQRNGSPNVGLMSGLVATAQHDHQHLAMLDVIHASAWPKIFTHLKHAFAYFFQVIQIAKLGLTQPFDETQTRQTVLQSLEPSGKLIELFHWTGHF